MTLFSAYKSYNPLRKLLVQLDVQGAKGKNEYELLEDSIATLRKQQREKESELHIQFVYNILLNQYQTVDELNIAAKERG